VILVIDTADTKQQQFIDRCCPTFFTKRAEAEAEPQTGFLVATSQNKSINFKFIISFVVG